MSDVVLICYCHQACKGGDEPGHEYNVIHHHTIAHIHVKEIIEVAQQEMLFFPSISNVAGTDG